MTTQRIALVHDWLNQMGGAENAVSYTHLDVYKRQGQRNPYAAPVAAHNLLRAHAKAVQAYRAEGRHQIGLVVNLEPKYPATETVEDLSATMRADAYWNRHYLDPVFLGGYPPELPEIFGAAWPSFPAADFDLIRRPPDFLGINYYRCV